MPRRTLLILFLLVAVSLACYRRAERNPYVRYFAQALEEIDDNYVEPVDDQKLFEGAITGMVDQLDRFSGFIPQHDAGEFQRMVLDQKFGGVGIEVYHDKKLKQLLVQTPIIGTPAYEAGIGAGDRIVAVDGHDTRDIETKEQLDRAVALLRGNPGQLVTLEVIHPGDTEPVRYELECGVIHVDSVLGDTRGPDDTWNYMLPGQDRIAYVRITTFGERTVDELETVLAKLSKQGMQGLILDLRNNPGGLLEAANSVCKLFLAKGDVIVTTRGRDRKIKDEFVADHTGPYPSLPLVVLVNRESASASEIVAAALQDHGRAVAAGERTFGKGTVQNVIPIEAGKSVLKLTIATYWRPSGKNIHRLESSKKSDEWGVKPNESCEVKISNDEYAQWEERRRQRRDVIPPKQRPTATEAKGTESNAAPPNATKSDVTDPRITDPAVTEPGTAESDVAGPPATDPPATDTQPTGPAIAEPTASDKPEAGDPQLEAAIECLEHEIHAQATPKAA